MLSEAQRFWETLEGKVKSVVDRLTKNTFRCERYTVTTAPNGTKIGVTLPMGTKEIFLPYSEEVAHVSVGTPVLVVWWGSMSNAKVCFLADGYDGVDVAYKVFDSVSDIGLTVGSAEISDAVTALIARSPARLFCNSSDFANDEVPNQYGEVEIVALAANRVTIWFYGQTSAYPDRRMYLLNGTPTGTWVKYRSELDENYVVYDSVEDINLTSGSATISGAYNALTSRSMLITRASEFASGQANTGIVIMIKYSDYYTPLINVGHDGSIYQMGQNSDHLPNGTWTRFTGTSDFVTEECTGSTGSISAGGNKTGSITITKSGYTPIAIAGFNSGNTWLVVTQMYISSSTTLNYTVRNVHASSNASGTVSVNILYRKN